MPPIPDPNQLRCSKCRAPLGQSIGRCPFCGTEIGAAPDPSPSFQPALVGTSPQNQARMGRPDPAPKRPARAGAAVFAAAALLLIAVGGTAAFFLIQDPVEPKSCTSVQPADTELPERAPLNLNGVVLKDGPEVDPTDVIHLVRSRVAGDEPPLHVKLLSIMVHRARLGHVNLDDEESFVTYEYLVIHRDPRADKERTAERVKFTLQATPPNVQKTEEKVDIQTVDEPTCVWSAAWRAAIASGLSEKAHMKVTYGWDEASRQAVWTFVESSNPEMKRTLDGKTCAIKTAKGE